jgi:folate-dependent phosphoribosylglycinamide formyltransferase PurN
VLVLSNRKAAYGLTRAQTADPPIATHHLALQTYLKASQNASSEGELEGEGPPRTRATYDAEIARIVLDARPDVVVLAGWMHVFGDEFLDAVCPSAPVINLHPALPGAFDGTRAIERGYEAFQRGEVDAVGAMVHRVVKEVDRGEPVVVREVEIRKGKPLAAYEAYMRGDCTERNGKSSSRPRERCWVKFDQRDLSRHEARRRSELY